MAGNQNFVIGNKTRIFFGILSEETAALDEPTAPPDSLVTLGAAALAAATSITVEALTEPTPAGTVLEFYATADLVAVSLTEPAAVGATSFTVSATSAAIPKNSKIIFKDSLVTAVTTAVTASGATSVAIKKLAGSLPDNASGYYFKKGAAKRAYTTASADTGDTAIAVLPLEEALADNSIALHKGLLLLQGGTGSEENISSDDTESTVYGDELAYSTGAVTGASWDISYDYNVLPSDAGYNRLRYAAKYALDGIKGWVRKEDPAPAGYGTGELIEGLCQVTDYGKSNPADGIITGSCSFTGRGTPGDSPALK